MELPALPRGWVWKRIDEVGEVRLGRQRSPKDHTGPYMRPYLRVANVFEARIDLEDVKEMNFTPAEYEIFRLEPGDILLNEGQSPHLVGRPAMYRGELPGACFQNTLVRFRAHSGLNPAYALMVFRAQMHLGRYKKFATITTNIAHLGLERFAAVEFPLAPREEQDRIVAELDTQFSRLDTTEARLNRALVNLKRARASVLKAAVEGRLVPTEAELARAEGRVAESASSYLSAIHRHRVHVAESKRHTSKHSQPTLVTHPPSTLRIPSGWCWTTVDTLLSLLSGGNPSTATSTPTAHKVLRSSAVRQGSIDWTDHRYLSSGSAGSGTLVEMGDLLITRLSGSLEYVGNAVLVRWVPTKPMEFPDRLFRGRLIDQQIGRYVELCFGVIHLRSQLESRAKSSAGHQRISLSDVRAFPIPLPPLSEQHRIVAEVDRRLSVLDRLEARITANLSRCKRLRQAILKRAFEGRLVPQEPRDAG